jgi:hypothetical protein
LILLLLGSVVFVLLGAALENSSSAPLVDFRAMYYPARCLLQHCDPYNENEVMRIYLAEGSYTRQDTAKERQMASRYGYLPSAFLLTIPFALLPWGPAHLLWLVLTAASLIFAAWLIWNSGASYAPVIAGCLAGFLLANSELLIDQGMCAGIAISLCVVAAWCFIRERFVQVGILCMALSLAVKPQDTGLVWLYFLLAGGTYRKRALQTLAATAVLILPLLVWVSRVAPQWMQELRANILAFSVHGGINDPGIFSSGSHGLAMVISLQSPVSVFWDDPHIYNSVSYLVCAPLLLLWAFITLRTRATPARAWLALASIAALTMLPVYHRQYDAKLLLLTVPACLMLWAEGGLTGWFALLVNVAGFALTGDLTWAILLPLINRWTTGLSVETLAVAQVFPAPMILLIMAVFYLWVYARAGSRSAVEPATVDNPATELMTSEKNFSD